MRPLTAELPSWPQRFAAAPEQAGQRLDVFLVECFPGFSRATVRRAIDAGHVRVDGNAGKASLRLRGGEQVEVDQIEVPREGPAPQAIALDLIYEDDAIVVVNKPAGMIVHPAKGHWEGTLASALAHHFGPLSARGGPTRPGIVHRLDRDTSGAIVVAKNDQVHDRLAAQFKDRTVAKEYLAIVVGVPDRERDIIEAPIGDHPTFRERKAVRHDHSSSREAVTAYEVLERFAGFAVVQTRPRTGRTHQIRIHLAHIGFPVLCDRLYGGRARIAEVELMPRGVVGQDAAAGERPLLERHALHAQRLALDHPVRGERMHFEAPLPPDLERTLAALRKWRSR